MTRDELEYNIYRLLRDAPDAPHIITIRITDLAMQTVADELASMAAAFEQSAADDWPDDGHADEHAAYDDGLLTAAARLRNRATALERGEPPVQPKKLAEDGQNGR